MRQTVSVEAPTTLSPQPRPLPVPPVAALELLDPPGSAGDCQAAAAAPATAPSAADLFLESHWRHSFCEG